jgi:hypothetical protein
MPISHPAMLTPASQTALACAASVEVRRERRAIVGFGWQYWVSAGDVGRLNVMVNSSRKDEVV